MIDDNSIETQLEQINKELAEKGYTQRSPKEIAGDRLKDFRIKRKMTVAQAAKKSGFSKGTISNYENGTTAPTLDDLLTLLLTYDTTIYEYFGIEKADYENDWNVFKRYGLSETFYRELVLVKKFREHNYIVNCINLIFEYPLYAFSLFEELSRFFNPTYHELIDNLPVNLPLDGAKRVLLEPVIQTLGDIFIAKYPERQKNAVLSLLGRQAADQTAIQAKLYKETEQHK